MNTQTKEKLREFALCFGNSDSTFSVTYHIKVESLDLLNRAINIKCFIDPEFKNLYLNCEMKCHEVN